MFFDFFMEEFIHYILSNIVDYPDDITLQTEESDYGYIRINATVNPEDMGKVIGKKGRTITAIRGLIKVKAIKSGRRVYFNLIDPEKENEVTTNTKENNVEEPKVEDIPQTEEVKVKSSEKKVEITADDFV